MSDAARLAEVCAVTEMVKSGGFKDKLMGGLSEAGTYAVGAGAGAAGGALLGAGLGYANSFLHEDPDMHESTRKKRRLDAVLRAAGVGGLGGAAIGAMLVRSGKPKLTDEQARQQATRETVRRFPEAGNAMGTALDPKYVPYSYEAMVTPPDGLAGKAVTGAGTLGGMVAQHASMGGPGVFERSIAARRSFSLVPEIGDKAFGLGFSGSVHEPANLARLRADVVVGRAPPAPKLPAGAAPLANVSGTDQIVRGMSDAEIQAFRKHIAGALPPTAGRRFYETARAKLPGRPTQWARDTMTGALTAAGNSSEVVDTARASLAAAKVEKDLAVAAQRVADTASARARSAVNNAQQVFNAATDPKQKAQANAVLRAAMDKLPGAEASAASAAAKVTALEAARTAAAADILKAGPARAAELLNTHTTRMNMERSLGGSVREVLHDTTAPLQRVSGTARRIRSVRGILGLAPGALVGAGLSNLIVNALAGRRYNSDIAARIKELSKQGQ